MSSTAILDELAEARQSINTSVSLEFGSSHCPQH
jgi:hypothetical protein